MIGGFGRSVNARLCAGLCARSRSFTSGGLGEGIHANLCGSHLLDKTSILACVVTAVATSSRVVSYVSSVFFLDFLVVRISVLRLSALIRTLQHLRRFSLCRYLRFFFYFQLFFFCWRVALFQKRSQTTCTCLHLQSELALVIKMSHLESSPHLSFSSLQLDPELGRTKRVLSESGSKSVIPR